MTIPNWLRQAQQLGFNAVSQATNIFGTGVRYAKASIGQTALFASTETSSSYDAQQVDEKHYFLVPDRRNEFRYSLYTMRCLPDGIPPINDLPKHRMFHLPNAHALPAIEHMLLTSARAEATMPAVTSDALGSRLNALADQIDKVDRKVFHGVLLIGGLVALVNPVAGAAVAMKAMLPSVGMLLSKFGLKYVGDKVNSHDLASRIRSAEKEVLKQFQDANTASLVNPVLAQLDRALDTTEFEYDPLLEFNSDTMTFGQRDRIRMLQLTCEAVTNTYEEIIDQSSQWPAANLGPEDIRFLKMLREIGFKR